MEMTDGELLGQFLEKNKQEAFQELLQRHGPMVMGVCRRTLGNIHDAEDAFQATFLVLSQKAGSLKHWKNVGGWLNKVACHCALNLKKKAAIRNKHETFMKENEISQTSNMEEAKLWEEVQAVLDIEISRLADRYRFPLVHCYLEGKSCEEAAVDLGLSVEATKTRLFRARNILRGRLIRHGLVLSSSVLGTLMAEKASANPPPVLMQSTLQIVGKATAAPAAAGSVLTLSSITVASEIIKTMFIKKLLVGTSIALIAIGMATITGVAIHRFSQKNDQGKTTATKSVAAKKQTSPPSKVSIPNSEASLLDDFRAEAERAWELDSREKRDKALKAVLERWIEADPKAVAQWVQQLPESQTRSNLLFEVAKEWAQKDPQTVAQWIQGLGENFLYNALPEVAKAWVQKDPMAAAQWVQKLKLPQGIARSVALQNAVEAWAQKDPTAAAQWLQQFPEEIANNQYLGGSIARAWAQKNPVAALQWAQQLPEGWARSQALTDIAGVWIQNDPAAAIQWAQQLPGGDIRNWVLPYMAREWVKKDPPAAILWAQQLPEGDARNRTLAQVAGEWAQSDLKAATEWIQQIPDENTRYGTLENVVKVWAEKDPAAAIHWAQQLMGEYVQKGEGNGSFDWTSVILGHPAAIWAQKDPAAANQWLESLPEGRTHDGTLASMAQALAEKDFAAAARWIPQLPKGRDQEAAVYHLLNVSLLHVPRDGASKKEEEEASTIAQLIQQMPEEMPEESDPMHREMRREMLNMAVSVWAARDSAAADRWARQLPEGNIRNQALASVASTLMRKDPSAAIQWAENVPMEAREPVDQAVIQSQISLLIERENDFPAALSAIQELPSHLHQKALETLALDWLREKTSKESRDAFWEWLKTQPPSDSKDHLITSLPRHGKYPHFLEIADQITESQRPSYIESTLDEWARFDPQSAKQWVDHSSLPETTKAKLLKKLESAKRKQ